MRLGSPTGPLYTRDKPIARGPPQGGGFSPFLWLLHFFGLHEAVRREVAGSEGALAEVRDLDCCFAGGIAVALTHPDPKVLVEAARRLADFLEIELQRLGLSLARPKCNNLAVSPGRKIGYAFRRAAGHTVAFLKELGKNDVATEQRARHAEQAGDVPDNVFPWP